jgi:hypothetical protein
MHCLVGRRYALAPNAHSPDTSARDYTNNSLIIVPGCNNPCYLRAVAEVIGRPIVGGVVRAPGHAIKAPDDVQVRMVSIDAGVYDNNIDIRFLPLMTRDILYTHWPADAL